MGSYEPSGVGRMPTYGARRRRKRSASKKKKRRRRRKSSTVCATAKYDKLTKPSRNPFLIFLRRYKQKHGDWTVTKVAVEGARKWCSMSKPQRRRYLEDALQEGRRRRKRDDGIRKGRRRRSKSKGGKSKRGKGGGRKRKRRKRNSMAKGSRRKLSRSFSSAFNDVLMDAPLSLNKGAKEEFDDY